MAPLDQPGARAESLMVLLHQIFERRHGGRGIAHQYHHERRITDAGEPGAEEALRGPAVADGLTDDIRFHAAQAIALAGAPVRGVHELAAVNERRIVRAATRAGDA